jgi:transposase
MVRKHAEQIVLFSMSAGARLTGDAAMDIVFSCCAGLDVHKDTIVVCLRRLRPRSKRKTESTVRTFRTTTEQILALADWLAEEGVSHVAMESTGVYWKPIWNLLESGPYQLLLVNAQHIKQVPGRKTDVRDCAWLAQLLQCGLLRGSFVPPPPQRELRELTRQRRQLIRCKAAVANRIQKVLEDANIKLGSVATDVLGKSGRAMLQAIIAGQDDPAVLAELAQRKLRAKIPQLRLALRGRVTDNHRFLLQLLLEEVTQMERWIEQVSQRIVRVLPVPFAEAIQRLATIPGIAVQAAEDLVAEIGVHMEQFATAGHLASWAGICSGNRQSGGKRYSGRTTKGNSWLRGTLVQVAWAASHTKGTYFASQYRRLAGRRGKKRALVALAHTILVVAYYLLRRRTTYEELGADYLDRHDKDRLLASLVRRLERMGHKVTLEPSEPAA